MRVRAAIFAAVVTVALTGVACGSKSPNTNRTGGTGTGTTNANTGGLETSSTGLTGSNTGSTSGNNPYGP